jgi:hypothetical protein
MIRARPAPSATRSAISRCRPSDRASSRFATFAQAMSSTNATAAESTNSGRRTDPAIASASGTTATLPGA